METRTAVSPLLTVLPLCLMGSVVLFDFGAVLSGARFFDQVGYWVLTFGLVVGLLVVISLLVLVTVGPIGPAARNRLGLVSGAMTGMAVTFDLVWWLRTDRAVSGASGGLLLLEVLALAVGALGASYDLMRPVAVTTNATEVREHDTIQIGTLTNLFGSQA